MLRSATALALILATPAVAHDAAQTAEKTAETPPAPLTPQQLAEQNARLNAVLPADQAAMKAHVMFLASDAMQGREAGSATYDVAAQYVAAQFYAAGLRPAGDDGGYLQRVPLVSYKPASQGAMSVSRGGRTTRLAFGDDFLPGADPSKAETKVDAPVVFVGYGVVSPTRNDYAGVDVRGKIVAFVGGAPASLNGEERAHFGNAANKATVAGQKGAVGVISIETPASARVRPFARLREGYDSARMTWANADGTGHLAAPNTPGLGALSMAGAAKLFAGAPTTWEKTAAALETGTTPFRAVELPTRLSVALTTEVKPALSSNVAGMLPGSDPKLANEVVVLTAHLDHVGVGHAVKGDTIYNGAMDNAVGIASLIEEAKRFKAAGKAPRRSLMFVAVTAEEKGLVGSDYFATNPTVAKDRIVANVNLDMPIITYKFTDVIAFGSDRTTLGPIVRKAASDAGATFSPDPMPEQGLFVRSDHYRFVQQGIPSVFLWPGTGGAGKAATDAFFANHYHRPSDDLVQSPPIDWASGVRFVDVNYQIAKNIANMPERPRWNRGDFFGTLYKGFGAQ